MAARIFIRNPLLWSPIGKSYGRTINRRSKITDQSRIPPQLADAIPNVPPCLVSNQRLSLMCALAAHALPPLFAISAGFCPHNVTRARVLPPATAPIGKSLRFLLPRCQMPALQHLPPPSMNLTSSRKRRPRRRHRSRRLLPHPHNSSTRLQTVAQRPG